MKADKAGLLYQDDRRTLGMDIPRTDQIEEAALRDLGGTVEFSTDEATFFIHAVGTQCARANLKSLRKKRKKHAEVEDSIDDEQDSVRSDGDSG